MHLCHTPSKFLCVFPSLEELADDGAAIIWAQQYLETHKEPHSEASAAISHTHTVKRTPGPIQHTAWSHYGKQCVLSQRWNIHSKTLSRERTRRRWNESTEDETKTWSSSHLPGSRLPPAVSSPLICVHQTYTGIVPTAYNNILQFQLSEELRGPHTTCKVSPVPGASPDRSVRDGASGDLRGRQRGPRECEL